MFKVIMIIMTTGYHAGGVDTLPFESLPQCRANIPIVEEAVKAQSAGGAYTKVFCLELKP
jgi:hypothetical protein